MIETSGEKRSFFKEFRNYTSSGESITDDDDDEDYDYSDEGYEDDYDDDDEEEEEEEEIGNEAEEE